MSIHIDDFAGKHVHMIGIGGSSMSGLAGWLLQRGYNITGSDNYDAYLTQAVRAMGIPVVIGHFPENVEGADLVIYSAAIGPENPERARAAQLGTPQMERSTLLGQLMEGYPQAAAIAGTHGKTTTTAMLAQALVAAGLDPAVHLGGSFDFIGGSTRAGDQEIIVAEACEFHASFLEMRPTVSVILNIEEDHLDFYRDLDHITETFEAFTRLLPANGTLIGNGDDERTLQVLQGHDGRKMTFGIGPENDWRPENLTYDHGCGVFDAAYKGQVMAHVHLQVGGDFNVLNALATLSAAYALGANVPKAAQGLSAFTGVHRRLEHTGDVDGVMLYHDYGHNPVEMRGALSVMKKQPHGRLWAVMQPHTYSRVKRLFNDYILCCEEADEILVTDIYGAREVDPGDIRSEMLVDAMREAGQNVHLTHTFDDTEAYLRAHWQPGDLVLTMGCGNINELNDQIQRHGDSAP